MSSKMMAIITSVIMIAIVVIVFPLIMDGGDEILREQTVDIETDVTAAAGSGTVTLANPLYDDAVDWVTTVTSSSGTDTPVASTYAATTRILTLTGLTWGGTRTITTTYQADNVRAYTGLQEVVEVAPLLLWVGAIIGVGAAGFFGVRRLRAMG